MQIQALQQNSIKGKIGTWKIVRQVPFFVDAAKTVVLPSEFEGKNLKDVDLSQFDMSDLNQAKIVLVQQLIKNNFPQYDRLQMYLDSLMNTILCTGEYDIEKEQLDRFNEFLNFYIPLDKKNQKFLTQYKTLSESVLNKLKELIYNDVDLNNQFETKNKTNIIDNKFKKLGLHRFPFLQQQELYLGQIEDYPTIPQEWNKLGDHWKIWKFINNIPFLINSYPNDEYDVVTRILASQIGKLLGLQSEECFFGYFYDKCVTLTAFHEAVTLLENVALELYPMAINYTYQSDQKKAFYFLIQNWVAYASTTNGTKERFDLHFIDSKGNVFLSKHEKAAFLKPSLMPKNLIVKFDLNKENYQAIKNMVQLVQNMDLAEIVFSSIPEELIELHDEIAKKYNMTLFDKKKEYFTANWNALIESIEEYEKMLGLI
jgi:hypothetical protein